MVGLIGDARMVTAMPVVTTPNCALRSRWCELWCQVILLHLEQRALVPGDPPSS